MCADIPIGRQWCAKRIGGKRGLTNRLLLVWLAGQHMRQNLTLTPSQVGKPLLRGFALFHLRRQIAGGLNGVTRSSARCKATSWARRWVSSRRG